MITQQQLEENERIIRQTATNALQQALGGALIDLEGTMEGEDEGDPQVVEEFRQRLREEKSEMEQNLDILIRNPQLFTEEQLNELKELRNKIPIAIERFRIWKDTEDGRRIYEIMNDHVDIISANNTRRRLSGEVEQVATDLYHISENMCDDLLAMNTEIQQMSDVQFMNWYQSEDYKKRFLPFYQTCQDIVNDTTGTMIYPNEESRQQLVHRIRVVLSGIHLNDADRTQLEEWIQACEEKRIITDDEWQQMDAGVRLMEEALRAAPDSDSDDDGPPPRREPKGMDYDEEEEEEEEDGNDGPPPSGAPIAIRPPLRVIEEEEEEEEERAEHRLVPILPEMSDEEKVIIEEARNRIRKALKIRSLDKYERELLQKIDADLIKPGKTRQQRLGALSLWRARQPHFEALIEYHYNRRHGFTPRYQQNSPLAEILRYLRIPNLAQDDINELAQMRRTFYPAPSEGYLETLQRLERRRPYYQQLERAVIKQPVEEEEEEEEAGITDDEILRAIDNYSALPDYSVDHPHGLLPQDRAHLAHWREALRNRLTYDLGNIRRQFIAARPALDRLVRQNSPHEEEEEEEVGEERAEQIAQIVHQADVAQHQSPTGNFQK